MPPQNHRDWLENLVPKLRDRWNEMRIYDAYYEGDQNLAFVTRKFRDAYGGLFTALTDNWMPIVVDASAERLHVQGFRFGNDFDADDDAWAMWQANNLDGESAMLHTEAIKLGVAYWMVAPPPAGSKWPRITAEHPSQVIVATEPGDRRKRLAALKVWEDGDEYIYANVLLKDRVAHYRTTRRMLFDDIQERRWELLTVEANPLGIVSVIPVPNNPSMMKGGRSDLSRGITRIQDALNVLLAGLLIGAEYQAYPLRVLLGVEQPENPDGTPIANADLKVSQSRLLMFPNADAKIGEFNEAKLEAFTKSLETLINHLTAQSRTPPHYVAGQIVNASGDALKAAETGLVSKVRGGKMTPFGESHEEMTRLGFLALDQNDDRAKATTDAETIWKDPETRSDAERVDAAVKLGSIGVPEEVLWERIGASPQEIDRWKAMQTADQLLNPPPVLAAVNGQVPPAAVPVP